jgi:hypothetical protein
MFQVGGVDVLVHKYLGPGSTEVWNSAKSYGIGEQVQINNKVYKAVLPSIAQTPPDTEYWSFVREGTPSQPVYSADNPFQIEDLLFLENRNRKYSEDVYVLRGVYNVQDIDFNLSQFGLFLQNDTVLFKKVGVTSSVVGSSNNLLISDDALSTASMNYSAGASQELALTFQAPTFAGGGTVTFRVVSMVSLVEVAY